jgi:hypothetical protein
VFLKLGLLTCAFYAGLTLVLEAGLRAVAYFRGVSVFASGRHPGLSLGVKLGFVSGVVWLIAFSAAWWIVYSDLKSHLNHLAK